MITDTVNVAVHLSQSEIMALEALGGSIEDRICEAIQEYNAQPPPAMETFRVSEGPETTIKVEIPVELKKRLERRHWRPCWSDPVSAYLRRARLKKGV